jgi:hypothetical protein
LAARERRLRRQRPQHERHATNREVDVATLRLTPRAGVRIRLAGNQTAAMFVKIVQVGGKRVGGTQRGTYDYTAPGNFISPHPLSDYGRKLVRRHGSLAVRLTFRIINGSGVTSKRVLSGIIRPE